jgi:hypothetical protein
VSRALESSEPGARESALRQLRALHITPELQASLAAAALRGAHRRSTGIHGGRPAWAALDPHQPAELLVRGEDGAPVRLRIE